MGKHFHIWRRGFPLLWKRCCLGRQKGLQEAYPDQTVTFAVGHANHSCAQVASILTDRDGARQGSARNLKRNLRQWPHGTVNRNQSPAGRDIQRGGEFKKVLASSVPAAEEEREVERQSGPPAALNT